MKKYENDLVVYKDKSHSFGRRPRCYFCGHLINYNVPRIRIWDMSGYGRRTVCICCMRKACNQVTPEDEEAIKDWQKETLIEEL